MGARAAVSTRWLEIARPRKFCSQTRRNGLSGRQLDTIPEERTLSNEELVAGLRSVFNNVCKLELMEDKNGKNTLGGL